MANVRISGFTGGAYADMKGIIESELKRGVSVVPVAGESAVLDFEQWTLQWCADNGRKLSQTEYGIAMAAFYSAHPAEGPFSHTMSGDTRAAGIREAAAEWQPIETAPQDSCWVLGLTQARRCVVVRWVGGAWEDDNRLCRDPKYWMPLPPSPPPQPKEK